MAIVALLAFAEALPAAEDGFAAWWPQFKAAVAKGDLSAMLKNAEFPMDWELKQVRRIPSFDDFAAHFDAYFPSDMKKAVATAKPVSIPGGQYMITWHARGNEYSLYFKKLRTKWALYALSEGPP